ncbi:MULTISPECIES: sigma-E factor regulatory protein RseB [Providencia]|uniref:Sigma factor negative regulatory protein n=1 Tax=Providencia heimbachae ATCC 35613 TaxID=1354272 RepID=A0A1B7JJG9_9GAMM|nr:MULTISPECIES: sigma-E factor regulatory protein RseB [Providencia]MBP6122591.1 sigma-E factor regulatory protein RseB [Providencia sp.]MDD9338563.1 sigma-E factor regulatory protein RseB [Providencia heimbachae]NIH22203.1 sigma-E factor regulatory protein RseB [Providencia heimbachae]OAT48057.1 sigma factor negative regulatory protein [Providencia heimbachae ATCC 35613]QCJ69592.1 sigma-E factor regulatory protein RseB [Providencia heimbachae]
MNKWLSVICLTGALIISNQASASQQDAEVLFKEMGSAAQNLSYEMSFMTFSPQTIVPVRYRHAIINGVPISQMIQMDSSRREIVQKGDEISYFEPGFDAFSLNGKNIVDNLPAVLFADYQKIEPYYNFIDAGRTHIGDKPALVIRIISKDNSRFNYVILVDEETKLPLRVDLLDSNNQTLEQFRVISTVLDSKTVSDSLMALSKVNLPPLLIYPKNSNPSFKWQVGMLPPGFEEISRSLRKLGDNDTVETAMFSDGLFTFSVNITNTNQGSLLDVPLQNGRRTIYSMTKKQNVITIIGELPLSTAQLVAGSVQFRE